MTLRTLKPSEGQITYWDKSLKTFGLRVSPGGTMTWTLLVGQERQRIKLGNYPTIGLKVARQLARERLAERTLGAHKPRSRSFAAALDTFEEVHCASLRPKTVYELQRLIRKHFLPKLGRKPLSEIAAEDITDITDRLSPGTAWHAHAAVGNFLSWCVPRYIKISPLAGVRRPSKSTPRANILTDDQLAKIWDTCSDTDNDLPAHYRDIVRLLIACGQRRGEIAAIQPSWITGDILTIPADVAKNGRQHSIPLSPLSLKLATGLATSRHLMKPYNAWSKPKKLLDELSGCSGYVLHDARRTLASKWASLGISIPTIERYLNHTSGTFGGIVGVYQRYDYMPEMRAAVSLWEAHLTKILA